MNKSQVLSGIVGGVAAGLLVAVLAGVVFVRQMREIERRLAIAEERVLVEDRIGDFIAPDEAEAGEAVAKKRRERYSQLGLDPPGSYRIRKATLNELRVDTLRANRIELIEQSKVALPDGKVVSTWGGPVRGILAAEDGKAALVLKDKDGTASSYGTNGLLLMRSPLAGTGNTSPTAVIAENAAVIIHVDGTGRGYIGISNSQSESVVTLEEDELGAGHLLLRSSA